MAGWVKRLRLGWYGFEIVDEIQNKLNTINTLLGKFASKHAFLKMMRGETMQEQDSGVVIVDKSRHLVGLLATCTLAISKDVDYHVYSWGDKELFWIGFAMVDEPYSFIQQYFINFTRRYRTGVAGVVIPNVGPGLTAIENTNMMHYDEEGDPSWANGGITPDKDRPYLGAVNYAQYYVDESMAPSHWEGFKLIVTGEAKRFTDEVRDRIQQIVDLYENEYSVKYL